jgi:hypothetical protein
MIAGATLAGASHGMNGGRGAAESNDDTGSNDFTAGNGAPDITPVPSGKRGYPLRTFTSGRYTAGYSDHLPVYVVLSRPTIEN